MPRWHVHEAVPALLVQAAAAEHGPGLPSVPALGFLQFLRTSENKRGTNMVLAAENLQIKTRDTC